MIQETRGRNLFFSTEVGKYINDCEIIFIAVNTGKKKKNINQFFFFDSFFFLKKEQRDTAKEKM